jgi:hypothetical protein
LIDELGGELAAVGIRGRRRERILAEFADHLACDPEADLGDPHELAAQFAAELAGDSARHAAFATFFALAGVAFAVGVPQVTLPTLPDITSGRSTWLVGTATLAMIIGAQVAFAAGCLAALRALRFDGARDVSVVRRRIAVALAGGAATAAGSALYALNFWGIVPDWWAILAVVSAGAAALPLAIASFAYTRGRGIEVTGTAPPRGLSADLGPLARPWLIGAAAVLLMLVGTSFAEGSVLAGAIRASFEAALFAVCFVAFRRPLALAP